MKIINRLLPFGIAFLAGCVAEDPDFAAVRPVHRGVFTAAAESESVEPAEPAAAGRWTIEELAVRAGNRAQDLGAGRLAALIETMKAGDKAKCRDPEFRFGTDFSGDNKYGVRLYIPNPFVDRYILRQGDAAAAACRAKGESAAFAVYTEVKLMGVERRRLVRRIELEGERLKILDERKRFQEVGAENNVSKSPYETILAETQFKRAELRLAELRHLLAALDANIARLADVPAAKLEIAGEGPAAPAAESLEDGRLLKLALARRPDLAEAFAEYDAAVAGGDAARAACIPWFRFVEGYYEDKRDSKSDNGDFSAEVAVTVPIFTWFGGSVRASNRVIERADARVKGLVASVKSEIAAARAEYDFARACAAEADRDDFPARVKATIDEFVKDGGAEAEAAKARLEVIEYALTVNDSLARRDETLVRLESVTGGTL